MKENLLLLKDLSETYDSYQKHMTAISKSVYFDVLNDIVNKHNNIIHKTITMKPIDVTDDFFC